jgi:CheY-like chemotaxis protein/HPt (histidine-containing phosphotransfer) domain-containing protein
VSLPLSESATAPAQQPTPLPACAVRILTRRHALAESLGRYATLLGLTVLTGQRDPTVTGREEILIADLDGYEDYRKSSHSAANSAASRVSTRVVLIASAAELPLPDRGPADLGAADTRPVVVKPVHRDALYDALAKVLGLAPPEESRESRESRDGLGEERLVGHVLLVEDEPVNAAVAQGYLAALGCTSVWVATGPAAVARSAVERFDLILMDLSMPGMDGFATTALIRQHARASSRVPIVALTAHDAASYRDICIAAGMDDLLSKPYTLEQCTARLRRWITPRQGSLEAPAPAPAPAPARLSSVDAAAVDKLRKLRAGPQSDLYTTLVELFRVGSKRSLAELRTAMADGDLRTAGAVCHKLASSAANVGALAFADDVRRLGRLCAGADEPHARRLYRALERAHPDLLETLMRLRLAATG